MVRSISLKLRTKLILGLWFSTCLLWFVYRGPYRQIFVTHGPDFATIYAATRLWLDHDNPYNDAATLAPVRQAAAGEWARLGPPERLPSSVYLPTVFPVIATFAWLPWAAANLLWCLLSIAAFLLLPVAIVRDSRLAPAARWLLAGAIFAFFPAASGTSSGNPVIVAYGLVALTLYFAFSGNPIISGILLGVACALKPQLSICAVGVLLLWRCWQPLFIGFGVWLGTLIASVLRADSIAQYRFWLMSLEHNLSQIMAPGGINDPRPTNYYSYHLLNTQAIAGVFVQDRLALNAIVGVVTVGLLLLYLRLRTLSPTLCRWRDPAFFSAWTLLLVYHRYYDATLLLLIVPYLLRNWSSNKVTVAALSICLALLAFPLQAALELRLGAPDSAHSVVDFVLFRHQPLLVLAICLLLIPWPAWAAGAPNDLGTPITPEFAPR